MSGVGAAVGLLLGGWLTGLRPSVFGAERRGLAAHPADQHADRHHHRAARTPLPQPSPSRTRASSTCPAPSPAPLGLLGLVYGLSRAGNQADGWSDTWTVVRLVAGVLLLALFVCIERRVEHPLLPFRVFSNRTRAASFVAMFFAPAAMFAMFFYLSQYIQNVMGYSPIEAGVAFLPFCFGLVSRPRHLLEA